MKPESMEELTFENDEAEDWGLGQEWLNHLITYVLIKALLSNCQCHNQNKMNRDADVSVKEYKCATKSRENKQA